MTLNTDGSDLLAAMGVDVAPHIDRDVSVLGVRSADLHFEGGSLPLLTVYYEVAPGSMNGPSQLVRHRYRLQSLSPGDGIIPAVQPPPPSRKLGKLPYQHDRRTLHLATYITQPLPPAPVALGVLRVTGWPMYGNDRLGDCTCAAAGHLIECWTSEEGSVTDVPEADVIAMYEAITGGQDTGAVELDVLRYWRKNGLAGHKPYAFALVDRMAHEHVKLAASLFAGVYIGIALPITAQAQTGPGKVWDVPPSNSGHNGAPGSWGGHAVNVVGYDADGLTVVTWGQLQRMTWAFWDRYVDECWALLPAEWAATPPQIAGFNFAAFDRDLARVGKETS